jgi:putative endonuclease
MAPVAFVIRRFSRSLNSLSRLTGRDGRNMDNIAVGNLGEKIARRWLVAQGAKVIYRNFRALDGGEVDIVAREGKQLLFTEVKTRRSSSPGRPLESVNEEKQRLIRKGANQWLKLLGTREIPWRYDVIEVILEEGKRPRVNRVENAFR